MDAYPCLRSVTAAIAVVVLAVNSMAADVAKGPAGDRDKDKKGSDSHGTVERSTTREPARSSAPAATPSPSRDSSGSRAASLPVPGSRPTVNNAPNASAFSTPSVQPRLSASSAISRDNWHDRGERDHADHDDRDRRRDEHGTVYGVPYGNGYFSGTATILGTGPNGLRVDANGSIWQVKPDVNAAIELTGTAGPDFLRPGMVVRFEAAFDPDSNDKDKAIEPITALEIITPHPGEMIGAVPRGDDTRQIAAAQPATARSLEVIGRITSYKQKQLTVSTGKRVFKAELDSAPQIKVRMADYQFARTGDQVELAGYSVRPGYAIANRIAITLAAPLGDPLSEFGKQKPADRGAKPAAGQP